MKNNWTLPLFSWVLSTVILEILAITNLHTLPSSGSKQAVVIDEAFFLLIYICIPIFTLITVFLIYSVFKFRSKGRPDEDGPHVTNSRNLSYVWVIGSFILVAFVFVHPGVTGVLELRAEEKRVPDVVIQAEAQKWSWKIMYLEEGVYSRNEVVLPAYYNTKFYVTSKDVLHAFWIPAFRVKIDAVPGMTTHVNATPTKLGNFDEDVNYRLQCAELCGIGHAQMSIPVRVLSENDYKTWLTNQKPLR
ncbi:MAG TPA: cytochrome c oxidase subunit II [SAR202 cluster bacterium]|jgi:cytochrome c oxidase subunit 2|nr:cytochrome c oxidase subunit II [SAR202 cluster bacterium]|tara:strand:- start:104509 stop:105249 length:741 start_codon:yes stop_codon:yes gene_type:complete